MKKFTFSRRFSVCASFCGQKTRISWCVSRTSELANGVVGNSDQWIGLMCASLCAHALCCVVGCCSVLLSLSHSRNRIFFFESNKYGVVAQFNCRLFSVKNLVLFHFIWCFRNVCSLLSEPENLCAFTKREKRGKRIKHTACTNCWRLSLLVTS